MTKPEAEIKKLVKDVKKSVKQAQDFAAEATLSTSTPPVAQNAFLHAGETNKISDSSSWSKNAVEMSQFKIKSAESLLAASKDVYKNSTNNFLEANRQLADFTAKLTGMEDKVVDVSYTRRITRWLSLSHFSSVGQNPRHSTSCDQFFVAANPVFAQARRVF